MNNFFEELKEILNKVSIWSEKFESGDRDYDFDIDNELYELSKKHSVDFRKGDLLLIYNLLDFYCDAVKHGFEQIDEGYPISQASSDISSINNILENSSYLELPENLKKRLISI